MRKTLRMIARHTLGFLTRLTIKKHKPTIIGILGDGETSVAREILYENIHQKYPARRNLEILEAEFSVPLTVLGALNYPSNIFKWLSLMIASAFRIIYLKPYQHFLIIEIPEINEEITEYWIDILTPQYILIEGNSKHIPKKPQTKIYRGVKNLLRKLEVRRVIEELPQPRIKIYKNDNNSTIIDSAAYYTSPPIESVLELIEKETSGKIILFSNSKKDQETTLNRFPRTLINPMNIKIESGDIVIKRGIKNKDL